MLEGNLKNNSAFLLPAFTVGIQDGMNPCGFVSALILVLFLARVGHTRKHVFGLGLVFLLSSLVTDYGLSIGMFDFLLTSSIVTGLIRGLYFFLAAGFIVLGGINIFDRLQYEKYFNPQLFKHATPAFLKDTRGGLEAKEKGFFVLVKLILLAVGIGAFVTLLSTIYPQQDFIYIIHSYYLSGGEKSFAYASFVQYSIALVLPQLIAWVAVLFLGEMRARRKVVLYYKGISAALFLSVGIGLGHFLLR